MVRGSRDPRAGRGMVLHTRLLIHMPLVPVSAHTLCSCDPVRSTLPLHSTLPNTHSQQSGKKGYRKGPGNLWRKKTKDDQNQETTRKNTRRDESRVTPMCEKQQFSDEKLWATALAREGRIMSHRCSPAQWGYEVQNEIRGQKLLNLFKNCQCINEIKEFPSKKCNLKQLKTVKRVNNFVQNEGSDYNLFKM